MSKLDILNTHIDLCMSYWDGDITEEMFEEQRVMYVSEEVDNEMQKDSCC